MIGDGELCVDILNAVNKPGDTIDAYTCNGTQAQEWLSTSNGELQAMGGCLDVTGGGTTGGSTIEYNTCDGENTQIWAHQANGEYVNKASGLCLDIPGGNTVSGAVQLDIQPCNDSPEEQWTVPGGAPSGAETSTTTPVVPTTLPTTPTVVPGANCSASTTGETQLNETGIDATTNSHSSAADSPENAITNAVNGTVSTRFSTDEYQAPGLDFEVNMGSAESFNEIEMATPDSAGDYATGYNVFVSNDGTSWTPVASCTGTGTPEIVSFPAQTAQYIEVVLTASSTTNWWSINQFLIYSNGSTGATTSTTAPTTTTVPTGTTTTTAPATTTTSAPATTTTTAPATTTTTAPATTTTAPATTTTAPATTTAVASGYNCSATVAGTELDEAGYTATTNAPASTTDAPQNAIINAVGGTGTSGANSTRFSTDEDQAAGLYYEVNMGSPQTFDEVEMNSTFWLGDYAKSYDVEVSNNDSSWTTVASCTGTASPEVVSFPVQTDRYLEVVLTTGVSTSWWSIGQFFVYGTSGDATTTSATTTTTSATTTTTSATTTPAASGYNCSATVSGTELNESGYTATTNAPASTTDAPENAITNAANGTDNSRFSTDAYQASGAYFQVDMSSAQSFDEIDMNSAYWPGDYARNFNVEVSSDGSSWTTVASCAGTGNPETVSFSPQTDQYLRVVLTSGSTTNWWSIAQFFIY